MDIKDDQLDSISKMRYKAEKLLCQRIIPSLKEPTDFLAKEIYQTIREVEVHRAELEMQNDELNVAQDDLETSQKLYFDLYDLAPIGYFVVNEKGVILKANLTAADLLGKNRSELLNQLFTRFIVKEDQGIYYRHHKMLFETSQPQTVELQMHRHDNMLFWARLDTVMTKNERSGAVYQAFLTDIGESKRSERALRNRIRELNFFFSLSKLLEKPFVDLDEVLAKTVLMIPQAWQFPQMTEACIELEGQVFQTEGFRKTTWMQTSDIVIQEKKAGQIAVCYTEKRVAFDKEPFLIEEYRLLNAIAQRLGHIIERIQMTDVVKKNELFLKTIMNSITNPFAVINATNCTIEMANEACGGRKVIGQKCYTMCHQRSTPCTGEDYPCPVLEVKRTRKPFVEECLHYDAQKNPSDIRINGFPVFDKNGIVIQVIVYETNITVRKNAERELKRKAAELEETNTALKVLLKKREQDKDEIEENIFANYQMLLSPIIQSLKTTLTQENQRDIVKILEQNLANILSPFSKKLSDKLIHLTPTEIYVAELIKQGKSSKEAAQILNCSFHTIARHRENIRIKTNLKNKKINLRSFLLSL
nr:PAS and helix-turn-helix domain-containing protein [uncultured Desulfobacter sp.]